MDDPTPGVVERALGTVLREILDGAPPDSGLLLNRGDAGLLRSLDRLSAAEASAVPAPGAASVAAHTEHLRYGLSLLNRWARGESPFADADWTAAWRENEVTDGEWAARRAALRSEAEVWQSGVGRLVRRGETELAGAIAEAAHLAYHLGAIRQIARAAHGPTAEESQPAP